MKSLIRLAVLSCVATKVVATHGGRHEIPEIETDVQSMTMQFAPAITYAGPPDAKASHYSTSSPTATPTPASYWLADIKHQGIAAFNPDPSYQVFRNAKDFGAKGDGLTDDTAAINMAMSSGGRCAPGSACKSTTTTPAIVYFPAGTYLISSSIIDYYFTQIIGNPNSLPVLKASPTFNGFGLIDGNQYQAGGVLGFGATNVFYRQVRNLVFDLTAIPGSSAATGIHWPTAQATSLQNLVFLMNDMVGTQHQGVFIEDGSGGFMNDLVFYGGLKGVVFGNQQFTVRNLTFYNAVTAISQIWDWGWTYKGINIYNCSVGLDFSSGGSSGQSVGSITFIDSSITNTPIGFITAHTASSQPPTAGSLILENIQLNNVPVAVQGPGSATYLAGSTGSMKIAAWGQGHSYTPTGPTNIMGPINPFPRPGSLLESVGKFYERSKPQYATIPVSQFLSVRDGGAKGDGVTDDTAALTQVIAAAAKSGKIVFFDAGTYKVTSTLYIPSGSKIVGESYPNIMGSGSFFSDMSKPQPVIRVGTTHERGSIEWSDTIVSTQGATAGAILIEFNLASSSSAPSGMWDVHARIGGFAGSNLQLAQCPTTPTQSDVVNYNCIAAFMTMHVTSNANGLYLENVWLWTADHDIEDPHLTQITIYNGRGLYVESDSGKIWLVGTAVEHHTLYQYQFASTKDIFMGQIQTETAYYQPNPPATLGPFPPMSAYDDPDFAAYCATRSGNCGDGWGLRVLNSDNILVYGAGLYSFFDNYSTTCSNAGNGETCQTQIFGIDTGLGAGYNPKKTGQSEVYVYNLNTIGATSMVERDGLSLASYADNVNVFPDNIAVFRTD